MKRLPTALYIALAFALFKVLLHLATTGTLGFHRDEYLYLALGNHPALGYWSNPPFIGMVSWASQHLFGDSLPATRILPALCGGGLLLLTGIMTRDLGGGRFAQVVCGMSMLLSVAWLRTGSMLQPVPFDVFFWTLLAFGLLRWCKSGDARWWWWIGATAGLGFLNKYTVVFWVAALLPALLFTEQRRILATRAPWMAAGLALLIAAPNLWWQWQHHFPVVHHMEELARHQLNNVQPLHFLIDQLLFHGPGGALVWVAGLVFMLRAPAMRPYRLLGWLYVCTVAIFLAASGKSYYTLGVYPVLFAAGAVWWEQALRRNAPRLAVLLALIALGLPLFPTGIPVWQAERLEGYFQRLTGMGIEATRWEDGQLHPLPQDYADMLGWEEIQMLADKAVRECGTSTYIIYGENYGQAGAVDHYIRRMGLPRPPVVASFADSYRLWAPDTIPDATNTLVYINSEDPGEDLQALFADIQLIGRVQHPLARERGTGVWLCRAPRHDVTQFWAERVREVKSVWRDGE